jgi:hypothetical protein
MTRNLIVVALCFLNSSALFAQRHGRADSIENFARQDQDTHSLLQIINKGSRHYFCTSDLRKMPRSVIVLKDTTIGISHNYEGVALEYLLSGAGVRLGSETIEVSYDHHQKMTMLDSTIASNSQILVADTIDGKRLTGYVPYSLIIRDGIRSEVTRQLTNVESISVKMSSR